MTLLYRVPFLRGATLRALNGVFAAFHRHTFGRGARVYGWPMIRLMRGSSLQVGVRSVLISSSEFSEWALCHACSIRTMTSDARVSIGDDVGLSGVTIVCSARVAIGDRVLIGANASITDTDSHPVDTVPRRYVKESIGVEGVEIADDVFIGANSIILKGAHIGRGSVIGAGSVVTGVIPEGVVAAGNPARVVRALGIRE